MANTCPKCKSDNPGTATFCADCGTQLPSVKDIEFTETIEAPKEELTRGTTFADRYEIIEELGKGGMGRVYRVEDTKLEQEVALKLIKPEIAKDKKTIERFRNELKLARNIRHKNVCGMFDLGETEGAHFITMEYVRGEDLRSSIRRFGQLPIGKSISIASQICDGLAEAHRQGVVHRDLKSNNIMIDKEGNVRIMDFGIARSLEAKGITGAGVMIGTPEYMSPEQVEGKDVDQRSDIYSLGVILYEMVTGRVPFEGETPFTVGVKQKSETPQNPKEINSQIPDDLNQVILHCLEKDKENRCQSAEEVRSELSKIEKGIPATERIVPERKPLTSREITVQFSLRKLLFPAIAIIAVVIIGMILWSPWSIKTAAPVSSDKPSLAVLYFRNGSGDASLDHWKETLCDYLITDLSQSKYIHILNFSQIVSILEKHNLLDSTRYSEEDLKSVAASGGASHILTGSFSKAGESFRIDYSLHRLAEGDGVASDRVEGEGEDSIFSMVDELTIKVKNHMELTPQQITNDYDKEFGNITTTSLEAYRNYREGRDLYHRMLYLESIPLMEEAISIDPDFAMAFRSIGVAYINAYTVDGDLGNWQKGIEYLTKAQEEAETSDKITFKEKLAIQGCFSYYVEDDYQKGRETFETLVAEYPEDPGANDFMGWYSTISEDWDGTIKYYELAVKYGVERRASFSQLGQAYCAKNMYEKAREVYRKYIANISDDALMHSRLAMSYAHEGRFEEAFEEAEKAITLNPNVASKGPIYHLQGDFDAAEKEYKGWVQKEETDWKMNGWRWQEFLYRMLGQYEKAKKEAQAGLKYAEDINHSNWKRIFSSLLAYHDLTEGNWEGALEKAEFIWESAAKEEIPGWKINALWWKIQVHLEQDNIEKAHELAEEAKKILDTTPSTKDIRDHLDNLGLIEMKKENYPKAIDLFSQFYELQGGQRSWIEPHAYILSNLASAYYLNHDTEKAKKEYENILDLTTGRLFRGDLYAKSFYMLGKIYEQQGNTAKAKKNYEKFLSLWKDADPGIAEVEDARKRLAGLKGN